MTDRVTRTLFKHSWTDKAVLVSPTASNHDAERLGAWLPLSQIIVEAERTGYNPHFGEHPGVALIMGTVITVSIPRWLADARKLTTDAEGYSLDCPDKGRCPHGEPINRQCDDCVAEHKRATA